MKKKPYWFKLYPADFLADRNVERMALDEFGLYCYLLMRGWMDGGIPQSLTEIGRYAMLRGMPHNKLERMWRAVGPCWEAADESPQSPLVNRRQEIERQNVSEYWGAKSRAGKASAYKRQKQKDNAPTRVEHVFNIPGNNIDQDIRQQTESTPPSPSQGVTGELILLPQPTTKENPLDESARRIHERHPAGRRCGLAEIRKHLRAILGKLPAAERSAKLAAIDANHAGWCQSEEWTKEGCQYAKGLGNWLAPTMGRFDEPPPAALPACAVTRSGGKDFVADVASVICERMARGDSPW
jgi:uncharacterized protein YdaU (DUF1376 family)